MSKSEVRVREKEELALWLNETSGITEKVTDEMVECYRYCISFGVWKLSRALKDFGSVCRDEVIDKKENTRRFLERMMR